MNVAATLHQCSLDREAGYLYIWIAFNPNTEHPVPRPDAAIFEKEKSMEKPRLYMLNPWVEADDQGPFYCPDCGVVEGFLAYSPEVKKNIEIIHVDFQRPRPLIIEAVGSENQGSPVLVLTDGFDLPEIAKKSFSTGLYFIDDALGICNFLGKTFNAVRPHP